LSVKPSPLTAALAGIFSSLLMPWLWSRMAGDSIYQVLAFVLLVALPAHAFVVGFTREPVAAGGIDQAMLKRVLAWLAGAGVTLLVVQALRSA
jgi:hypothetical protein